MIPTTPSHPQGEHDGPFAVDGAGGTLPRPAGPMPPKLRRAYCDDALAYLKAANRAHSPERAKYMRERAEERLGQIR